MTERGSRVIHVQLGSYKTSEGPFVLDGIDVSWVDFEAQLRGDLFLIGETWPAAVSRGRDYDIVRVWTGWIRQALDWPGTRPVVHFFAVGRF
jgi:hypothetical protein